MILAMIFHLCRKAHATPYIHTHTDTLPTIWGSRHNMFTAYLAELFIFNIQNLEEWFRV
jgi:hypothetical protein